MSQQLRFAPTITLPFIEVEVVTGPGTNYPFGRFDLGTTDGAAKFDLFSALASRIPGWNFAATATYFNHVDLGGGAFHETTASVAGNFENLAVPLALGPADVVLGDVESNNDGPLVSVWDNPHGSNVPPAEFAAQGDHILELIALGAGYDESVFAMNDVRLVSGPVGAGGNFTQVGAGNATTGAGTVTGFYDVDFTGGLIYNSTLTGTLSPRFGPFYAHSFRSRRYGYVAFILQGAMGFSPSTGGNGFSYSTHLPSLQNSPGAATDGEVGTLTVQWPHAITGETLTLTCPIYATPGSSSGVTVAYTVDLTMTPALALEYGGIYDPATGAPLSCPLN